MTLGETITNQLYNIIELKRQLWEAEKELTRLNLQYAYGLLACAVMNVDAPDKAPKPIIAIVTKPSQAPIPKAVSVNWSRGFSGAQYPVLGYGESRMSNHLGERYYIINNSTDENRPMLKHVWAKDCKVDSVLAIVEKAAA